MKIEYKEGRMTKKLALFLCWKLWAYMQRTGSNNKDEWPQWERNGGKVAIMMNDCPCCEYTMMVYKTTYPKCSMCPMKGLWGSKQYACQETKDSPYELWRHAGLNCWYKPHRKTYAGIIARFAWKEYLKLEK